MRGTKERIRPWALARLATSAGLATLLLAASASPSVAVTIGQLAPGNPPAASCVAGPFDGFQETVTAGNGYVVPATGGVTNWTLSSWSHSAAAGAGQQLTMKVFRLVSGNVFQAVVHDGPRPLAAGVVNTFSGLNLAVKAGDILGNNDENAGAVNNACVFSVPGQPRRTSVLNLADGQQGTFGTNNNFRINTTAEVNPTNTFTLGGVTRSKKKGTATVAATVPNPGTITVSGNGVKTAAARTSVAVSAGTAQVPISASGKKKKKLKTKGKVNLSPTLTYTPTGGTASTQGVQVNLKKKLKPRK